MIARRFMRLVCTLLRSFLRVKAPKVALEKCNVIIFLEITAFL